MEANSHVIKDKAVGLLILLHYITVPPTPVCADRPAAAGNTVQHSPIPLQESRNSVTRLV